MKGIFWNCNGFADGKKYRFLSDLTKDKSLDFIALSETGRASFPQNTLNTICAGRDFIWHCMAPHGRSGGLILGVHLLTFDVGEIEEGDFLSVLNYDTKNMILNLILFQFMVRPRRSLSQTSCLR